MILDASTDADWRTGLERRVRSALAEECTGHDAHHALRVRDLALRLARSLGADSEIVEATALLHDVGHRLGRARHVAEGVELARRYLTEVGFPREKRTAVIACIARHEWRPNRSGDPENPSLEFMVLADADRLDALGAIGIARTFAFGGAHGRPMWVPDGDSRESTIRHFYDKLLRLPDDMYTDLAKAWAIDRVRLMEAFLKSFFSEWAGTDRLSGSTGSLRPGLCGDRQQPQSDPVRVPSS